MAAEGGSGGRLLARGLLAAALALVMLVLGVRTMVGRMSGRARSATATSAAAPSASGAAGTITPPGAARTAPGAERTPPATGRPPADPALASPAPAPASASSPAAAPDPAATVHHGTLDAMTVRSVVREALPEIRFCFEWQLNAHPDLAGRVTMQFTIQEDGSVADASVLEDALHDDTVTTCFTHVMSHLRFPPPEGGSVSVNYPFSLSGAPEAQRPEGI